MGSVDRLSPAVSNPVFRIDSQLRERRQGDAGEFAREERDDPATKPDAIRPASDEERDSLVDPDAPGSRVDIKA